MKDIWEYNKKTIIVSLILLLIILIVIFYGFIPKNTTQKTSINTNEIDEIVLLGSRTITLNEGDKYVEPGYYAITKGNEIKQDEVIVTGEDLDTSIPGTYYITYTIGNKKETREIVIVEKEKENEIEKEEGEITLTLKGESMLVINVGSEYIEPGYVATDTIDGDITKKVDTKESVDTGVPGTYTITYEVKNTSGKSASKTRTVVVKSSVIEASITGTPTSYTKENVTLKIEVEGDNFYYVKNPDGTITKEKTSTYEVNKNGTYKFLIYDKENNYITKEVVKIKKVQPELVQQK